MMPLMTLLVLCAFVVAVLIGMDTIIGLLRDIRKELLMLRQLNDPLCGVGDIDREPSKPRKELDWSDSDKP